MDKDSVKLALTSALSMLAFVARLTPTQWDDSAIAALSALVEKSWFIDFVVYVLSILQTKEVPQDLIDELRHLLQANAQQV